MNFDYLSTKSPDFVLKRLTDESRGVVVNELAGILAAHQARELADQCESQLPGAEKEVKRLEKEFGQAQKAAAAARADFEKVKRAEEDKRRKRGISETELLAAGAVTKQKARELEDAESAVRFLSHDLRLARQHVKNLTRLSDGLGDYKAPESDVLPLLAKALENGNG